MMKFKHREFKCFAENHYDEVEKGLEIAFPDSNPNFLCAQHVTFHSFCVYFIGFNMSSDGALVIYVHHLHFLNF